MKKFNILHIITKLELGGAQKNALYTIAGLDDNKYNKHLISSRGGLLQEEVRKIPHLNFRTLASLTPQINPPADLIALGQLISYIKRNKIDIVHTHSSKAGILGRWAAKLAGVSVIIHTIHGWSFNKYLNFFVKRLYVFLERVTSCITDKFVAVSQSDIRKGLSYGIGRQTQYTLVRCGIDIDAFKRNSDISQKKREFGLQDATSLVGMVACFKPQKNPLDFIRAAAINIRKGIKAKFVLVGDGCLRKKIERLVRKEKLEKEVLLLGWRKDVDEIMPIFDVVVLTSLWEGLPTALLEAVACAKPIVAYNVDGVGEIVKEDVNGFLAEPGDVERLSERITSLLKDKPLSAKMGDKGRSILEKPYFNPRGMVAEIDKVYTDIMSVEGGSYKSNS